MAQIEWGILPVEMTCGPITKEGMNCELHIDTVMFRCMEAAAIRLNAMEVEA